jgi:glycosyltransferase involved in cell wall biosynthesis
MAHVSVFIPVWNDTSWLPRAIQSVVQQSHADWELVVGDNASTENVEAVVEVFGDPRIRYHRFDRHTNIFENFNRTCMLCRHDWVHLLAADDRLSPVCLERIAAAIDDASPKVERLAMVAAGCHRLDPEGRPADHVWYGSKRKIPVSSGTYNPSEWLAICCEDGQPPWNLGSVTVSRSVIEESGGFLRPEIGLSNDFEMAMRVGAYGSVVYIDEPLLDFTVRDSSDGPARLHRNRSSGAPQTVVTPAFINAMAVHDLVRGISPAERRQVNAAIARSHLQRGAQHRVLPGGRGRMGALSDVRRAFRYSPRTILSPYNLAYSLAAILAPTRLLVAAKDYLASRHS